MDKKSQIHTSVKNNDDEHVIESDALDMPSNTARLSALENDISESELGSRESCSNVVALASPDDQPDMTSPKIDSELHPVICVVCKRTYKEPRALPCLHTFCAGCIPSLRNKERLAPEIFDADMEGAIIFSAEYHMQIKCPICQWRSKISRNVLDLPRNLYVERQLFLDSLRNRNSSVCEACLVTEDVHGGHVVVSRCLHCGENLCQDCSRFHKRQKRTSAHIVVNIDSSSGLLSDSKTDGAEKSRSVTWLKSYKCHKHEDEELKMCCVDCDEVLCRDCVVLEHRTHHCKFVDEALREGITELTKGVDRVGPTLQTLKKHQDILAKQNNKFKVDSESVRVDINCFLDKYIEAIELHRLTLHGELDSILASEKERYDAKKRELDNLTGTVKYACAFTSSIIEKGSDIEIMSIKKTMSKRLDQVGRIKLDPVGSVDNELKHLRFSSKDTTAVGEFMVTGKILGGQAFPEKCRVTGDGLINSRRGLKSKLHLMITDTRDEPVECPDDVDFEVTLFSEIDVNRPLPVSIQSRSDGVYLVSFTPEMEGGHILTINVDGRSLQGSPCCILVKGKQVPHVGVWHCCAFCSSNGNRTVTCGCGAKMPGGFHGCGHGHQGHPGTFHWSCCGAAEKRSDCSVMRRTQSRAVQQFTL